MTASGLRVSEVRVEYLRDPMGIDTPRPRLSWVLQGRARGSVQSAYRIRVATAPERLRRDAADLWDSGKVLGQQQLLVPYQGPPLASRQRAFFQVMVWDGRGHASDWSETGTWEMGLLARDDWRARWIGAPEPAAAKSWDLSRAAWIWFPEGDGKSAPVGQRYLRRRFELPTQAPISAASLIVGANDNAIVAINGIEVARAQLGSPGALFDVTRALKPGANVITAKVENTGGPAGFLAHLEVHAAGRSPMVLTTDESFRVHDAEVKRWTTASFDDRRWRSARIVARFDEPPFEARPHLPAGSAPAPHLRKSFALATAPTRARVYLSGLGYYELYVNGRRVGDQVLDPGYTAFDKRVQYVTHDVTEYLVQGENTVGVMLGSGFYDTHARDVWEFHKAPWRGRPRLLLQLHAQLHGGDEQVITSDETWQAGYGPVTFNGIRNGESYDARREDPDWARPGAHERASVIDWQAAVAVPAPKGKLVARMHPPMRVTETRKARAFTEPAPGVYVFDLGQNIAGWARIRVKGPAGTRVVLRYGERLDDKGMLDRQSIEGLVRQGEFQTDSYTLEGEGEGEEVWEPRFVYHGFQYVEVTGLPAVPKLDDLEGRVVHTDFTTAGWFASDSDLLDKIQDATSWSYRGNFHGIPTDCPHREKNGWTGDAHLAVEAGMFNFDNAAGYRKWVDDLLDSQRDAGDLPGIVPSGGWGFDRWSGPSWEIALFEIPWALYRFHGDRDVLATVYPAWQRYLQYLAQKADGDLVDIGLGDWVPWKTRTPVEITSSAQYLRAAERAAAVAAMLGRVGEADRYSALAGRIRNAFRKRYMSGAVGEVADGQDTALAVALAHGIASPAEARAIAARLAQKVAARDFHLDTGVIGAKYALRVLAENGFADIAYRLATSTTAPSWGHWIAQGASTLWESWDGNDSRNHIFFGDISAWFFEVLAGLRPDDASAGWGHAIIRPFVPEGLSFAKARHRSPRGVFASEWRRAPDGVHFEVEIPANAQATLILPIADASRLREGERPALQAPGVSPRDEAAPPGHSAFRLGSGRYHFVSPR